MATTAEERLSRLEASYEHLATKADLANLKGRVNQVDGGHYARRYGNSGNLGVSVGKGLRKIGHERRCNASHANEPGRTNPRSL